MAQAAPFPEKPHHPHWPLAALVCAFVFALGWLSVHEPATWIHIRTGGLIARAFSLPRTDPFSYSASGRPWSTDSWLCDLIFYGADSRFGPNLLVALKAALVAAAFALLLPLNPANPVVAAAVLAAGAVSLWPAYTETPVAFDLLMLSLLIRLLRPREAFRWELVPAVAGVELLWANLHGTAAVLGVFLVALKVFKTSLRTVKRERLCYLLLLAVSGAALAANPHGWAVVDHMFHRADAAPLWRPPSAWLNLYAAFAAAGAAAGWICLQQEFFLTMTAGTLLALSLVVPVLRPLYLLSACPVISLALGYFLKPRRETLLRVAWLAVAMAWALAFHAALVYRPLARARGYDSRALEGALTFLDAAGVRGKAFNEAETGGALIGVGRPVFVDDRPAVYGASFLADAARWPTSFRQLADVYGFDYALILNRRARYPARVIDEDPEWALAYADDWALAYVRRSGVAGAAARRGFSVLRPNALWPDALDAAADPAKARVLLAELDRWILSCPESLQAILWKAYALDQAGDRAQADGLVAMAQRRHALEYDPELLAIVGAFHERRGEEKPARQRFLRAVFLARRRDDRALESVVLHRLADLEQRAGAAGRARELERRAIELLAEVQ